MVDAPVYQYGSNEPTLHQRQPNDRTIPVKYVQSTYLKNAGETRIIKISFCWNNERWAFCAQIIWKDFKILKTLNFSMSEGSFQKK